MIQPSSIEVRLDRMFQDFENHKYSYIDPSIEQADLTRLIEPDGDDPFIWHPGDRWGVCAGRWLQSYEAGVKAPVILAATNEAALDHVPLDALTECAADIPPDISGLMA